MLILETQSGFALINALHLLFLFKFKMTLKSLVKIIFSFELKFKIDL